MLPISTVYICWQNDDFIDAYIGNGYQVILITKLSQYSYSVFSIGVNGFLHSILRPDSKLWIEEGINGVAA